VNLVSPCHIDKIHKENEKKFQFFFSLTLYRRIFFEDIFFVFFTFTRRKKIFEENFYINIPELIIIHISADGHPITFV